MDEIKFKTHTRNHFSNLASRPAVTSGICESTKNETVTILVVDDNESVCDLISFILKKNGYNVIESSSVSNALQVLNEKNVKISLLVIDYCMPGMRGDKLAFNLIQLHSEMKILYTSGYGFEGIEQYQSIKANINIIEKPFSFKFLLKKVENILKM